MTRKNHATKHKKNLNHTKTLKKPLTPLKTPNTLPPKPPKHPPTQATLNSIVGKPRVGRVKAGKPKAANLKPSCKKRANLKPACNKRANLKPACKNKVKPKSAKPKSGKPKSGKPKSGKPKSAKPKSGKPKSAKPKSGKPKSTYVPITKQDLKRQQKEWYAKLKATGFRDLENMVQIDGLDGQLSNSGYQLDSLWEASQDLRQDYYRRLTNYVTHNPNWANQKLANLIGNLYVQGISYRRMLPIIKATLKIKTSLWTISQVITMLERLAKTWNKVNPEGLDFVADLGPRV